MSLCLRCQKPLVETDSGGGPETIFCNDCRSVLRNRLQQQDAAFQSLLLQQVVWTSRKGISATHLVSLQNSTAGSHNEDASLSQLPTAPVIDPIDQIPAHADGTGGEDEDDNWVDQSDPLMARHLPNAAEGALIEEEDIQRAVAQGVVDTKELKRVRWSLINTLRSFSARTRTSSQSILKLRVVTDRASRLRLFFILLGIVAAIALIADSVFIFLDVTRHPSASDAKVAPVPIMSLTPGTVHFGQIVLIHLDNFSSSAHVLLTHDIQEKVRDDAGSSLIRLGANGQADVRVLVEDSWGPGSHLIAAEDARSHYTASATLQVISDLPLHPPHLLVSLPADPHGLKGPLDMGTDLQGTNTIRSLVLSNTGGSWISWIATSDVPWLMVSPPQGIFRSSQNIFIGMTRANLKPGDYKGTITIVSNTGTPVFVQVKMAVLPLSAVTSPVIVVAPPVLSFTATDWGADPVSQLLTLNNPGVQPLQWSLFTSVPQDVSDTSLYPQNDVSWLSTNETSGTVAPGATELVHVIVHSHNLLPSVYSGLFTFHSVGDAVNSPQPVVVTLTVQPICGVATSLGSLAFTAISGQSTPGKQMLDLNTTAGCADAINWQSFSSTNWLNVTPASGNLQPNMNTMTAVMVNVGTLQPGTYSGFLAFLTDQRSQTIMVQLNVVLPSSTVVAQATVPFTPGPGTPTFGPSSTPGSGSPTPSPIPGTQTPSPVSGSPTPSPIPGTPTPGPSPSPTPQPTPPIMTVSSLTFEFMATQGQNPPGQIMTLGNSGGSSLYWQADNKSSWLNIAPIGGMIRANQSTQMALNVTSNGLATGTYNAQITVTATDGSGKQVQGSPQTISVSLKVYPPCTLQESPSSLIFTATLLQPQPPGQNITFKEVGNCARPVSWTAFVDSGSRGWLTLSATSGYDNGSGSTIVVHTNAQGKLLGTYTGTITLSAIDGNGVRVQSSPQAISVTLLVIT